MNSQTPARPSKQQRGMALIIVISVLSMLTILVVAMLTMSDGERVSASHQAEAEKARELADLATNVVMGQIWEGTKKDSKVTTLWASQPGAVRKYAANGMFHSGYKLYSSSEMVVSQSGVTGERKMVSDVPPQDWDAQTSRYGDLNEPVIRSDQNGDGIPEVYFPVIDPRAYVPGKVGKPDNPTVEGFSYQQTVNGAVYAADATDAAARLPMPVEWLYVLQDGTVGTLNSSNAFVKPDGRILTVEEARANPIVGRVGFWTDDESCKVNINTAGEPTFWAVPTVIHDRDLEWAFYQPTAYEYQRYPGHPATVALSSILFPNQEMDPYEARKAKDPVLLDAIRRRKERIAQIIPKINSGGSQAGTRGYWNFFDGTDKSAARSLEERLYASVDELLFSESVLNGRRLTNDDASLANGTPIFANPQTLERARFFLTAHSRMPEITMFGTPRVAMWPVAHESLGEDYRTGYDELIAFCASLGRTKVKSSSGTGSDSAFPHSYFFRRRNADSPIEDINLTRNLQLLKYLRHLMGETMPGGSSLNSKYGSDAEQIRVQLFDYIRTTNLYDGFLAPPIDELKKADGVYDTTSNIRYKDQPPSSPRVRKLQELKPAQGTFFTYTDPRGSTQYGDFANERLTSVSFPGHGQVVPSRVTTSEGEFQGFGRFVTLSEVGFHFICTADGTPDKGSYRIRVRDRFRTGDPVPLDPIGNALKLSGLNPQSYRFHVWKPHPTDPNKLRAEPVFVLSKANPYPGADADAVRSADEKLDLVKIQGLVPGYASGDISGGRTAVNTLVQKTGTSGLQDFYNEQNKATGKFPEAEIVMIDDRHMKTKDANMRPVPVHVPWYSNYPPYPKPTTGILPYGAELNETMLVDVAEKLKTDPDSKATLRQETWPNPRFYRNHPGFDPRAWNATLDDNTPLQPGQRRVQGMLCLEVTVPASGRTRINPEFTVEVKGLSDLSVLALKNGVLDRVPLFKSTGDVVVWKSHQEMFQKTHNRGDGGSADFATFREGRSAPARKLSNQTPEDGLPADPGYDQTARVDGTGEPESGLLNFDLLTDFFTVPAEQLGTNPATPDIDKNLFTRAANSDPGLDSHPVWDQWRPSLRGTKIIKNAMAFSPGELTINIYAGHDLTTDEVRGRNLIQTVNIRIPQRSGSRGLPPPHLVTQSTGAQYWEWLDTQGVLQPDSSRAVQAPHWWGFHAYGALNRYRAYDETNHPTTPLNVKLIGSGCWNTNGWWYDSTFPGRNNAHRFPSLDTSKDPTKDRAYNSYLLGRFRVPGGHGNAHHDNRHGIPGPRVVLWAYGAGSVGSSTLINPVAPAVDDNDSLPNAGLLDREPYPANNPNSAKSYTARSPRGQDVLYSFVPVHGDARLLATKRTSAWTEWMVHPRADMLRLEPPVNRWVAHNFTGHWTGGTPGFDFGPDPGGTTAQYRMVFNAGYSGARFPDVPMDTSRTAVKHVWSTGDFDNAAGTLRDGPWINKPDEGDASLLMDDLNRVAGTTKERVPNAYGVSGEVDWIDATPGQNFMTPNRMVASPGMFGSLPTGVKAGVPWRTLLFRPNVARTYAAAGISRLDHYGAPTWQGFGTGTPSAGTGAKDPADHFLMDLFWMPVVEPYAISEPLSSAGKVNINYQIVPFSHIRRATALHAVLKGEVMTVVPVTDANRYKRTPDVGGEDTTVEGSVQVVDGRYRYNQPWSDYMNTKYTEDSGRKKFWHRKIDIDTVDATGKVESGTLKYVDDRFNFTAQNNDRNVKQDTTVGLGLFRTASQICEVHLLPKKVSGDQTAEGADPDPSVPYKPSQMEDFWFRNGLTGDNTRERPYTNLYGKVTTQSNTFRVFYRAQVIKKARSSDPTGFDPLKDSIVTDHRGSSLVERRIDPADARLPDYGASDTPARERPLDEFYRFRVLETKRFMP